MNRFTLAVVAATVSTSSAFAGGLDRSGQRIGFMFEEGNYAELSFGYAKPSVDGNDVAAFGGQASGNAADNFIVPGVSVKADLNENVSFGFVIDEPYGSDISYPAAGSVALGGTKAIVDSYAITALGRYKFGNGFSVLGGVRYQEISADVTLRGAAYGALGAGAGYNGAFASDGAWGYVAGVAYERPEIALRVALTYNSQIDHELDTVETSALAPGGQVRSKTDIRSPESLNLEFQTGVAKDTLVFGSIRYAKYDETIVSPTFFDAAVDPAIQNTSLTTIENSTDFEIGVGRRITDRFSASLTLGYATKGDDDLVSPLSPVNGSKSIAIGASYLVTDQVKLSGGIRYTALGDARPETGTPDTARANFTDNSVIGVGFRVGYSF